jgi:hydrogenase maturation protease
MSTTDGAGGAPRIVVIGLGNPLMADDGFGIAAMERLKAEWRFDASVTLVDGGTWGLSLLPIIECADHLLLVDAIRAGKTPGTMILFEGDDVPRCLSTKLSPHQIDLREVLALAQFRGTLPSTLIALGVEPGVVDLRDGLSPVVHAQLDYVIALVVDRLRSWGASASLAPLEEASCTR